MNGIDQNSALMSLEKALVPGSSLIDGRTEKDRLSFMTDFASLINFYDSNNKINGSWTPFLLKDPVFLLAHISKTNFTKLHSLYINTCLSLEAIRMSNKYSDDIPVYLNRLFDQIIHIFMTIERWTYQMQRSEENYDLRKYVLHHVKLNYSKIFWAVISLRENLYMSSAIIGIDSVKFYLFNSYDELIWKQNRDKMPYWDVFNITDPITKDNNTAWDEEKEIGNVKICFDVLTKSGDDLFNFFHTIITHSHTEFEKLKDLKSRYPDTTLLRTFVNVLKIHQDQLNGISQKHLDFYYKDILKQVELPALADNVYVCAELAKKDVTFFLPAGTDFDAGLDDEKNPVIFSTAEDVSLNPASIICAYTLAANPFTEKPVSLYLQTIPDPGKLQLDEDGKTLHWKTFGGAIQPGMLRTKLGIVFASPMLLLREGQRTITLTLNFASEISREFLEAAHYFLSTKETWLNISLGPGNFKPCVPESSTCIIIEIDVSDNLPAIEPFTINPDGLKCCWPMLKIEFDSFPGMIVSPALNSFTIQVEVLNVNTFQLYNDHGALSTKTSFPLFGTTPKVNSSFIIGNNEIFSKPINSLSIELEWDKLPDNFQTYYQQYNNYLRTLLTTATLAQEEVIVRNTDGLINKVKVFASLIYKKTKGFFLFIGKVIVGILTLILKFFKGIINAVMKLLNYIVNSDPAEQHANVPFNNVCFTVDFNLLQGHSWLGFNMAKVSRNDTPEGKKFVPYPTDKGCVPPADKSILLFDTNSINEKKCALTSSSCFAFEVATALEPSRLNVPVISTLTIPSADPKKADPTIQMEPFKYNDNSSSGFIKMVLSGPEQGFGFDLHSKVVSDTALKNALIIAKQPPPTPPNFIPAANLPFTPKVKILRANYKASQTYNFNTVTDDYPLQCFLISPFTTYKAYDNSADSSFDRKLVSNSIIGESTNPAAMTLFPSFNYNGALFIEMENLIPQNQINLYFQLARNYGITSALKTISYYYLSQTGWNKLPVLQDGTNNFSCSGIIKVNVPADVTNQSPFMPGPNYWISITETGDPALFSETIFLKANGIPLQRKGISFLKYTQEPKIEAGIITKAHSAIPQIASIIQPFPSFGGKAAEDQTNRNRRVNSRIKTKDRVVSAEDFFRLIRQQYSDIYYSKAIYNSDSRTTVIYVVKAFTSYKDPGAFIPLITECKEFEIQTFLKKRASAFANVMISNFDLRYVQITVTISVKPGYEFSAAKKSVSQALDVFLSPWIKYDGQQLIIDTGIDSARVTEFVKNLEGVLNVEDVFFETFKDPELKNKEASSSPRKETVLPQKDGILFVSGMDHIIQLKE